MTTTWTTTWTTTGQDLRSRVPATAEFVQTAMEIWGKGAKRLRQLTSAESVVERDRVDGVPAVRAAFSAEQH